MKRGLDPNPYASDAQVWRDALGVRAPEDYQDGLAQEQPEARVVPREAAQNQPAQQAQAILPQSGAVSTTAVHVRSEPALAARRVLGEVAGMPESIWKIILSKLNEIDLARARQVSYSFSDYAANVHLAPLDVESSLARTQRTLVRSAQHSVLAEYLKLREAGLASIPGPDSQEQDLDLLEQFGNTLATLAARYRCLDIPLVRGFEDVVLNALKNTWRWQNLRLHLGPAVLHVMSRLAPLFVEHYSRPARTIDLYLSLRDLTDFSETVRLAKALPLRALVLDFDCSPAEVTYDQLQALAGLLSGENQIHTLKVYAHDSADTLLSWLKTGTPNLQRLGLAALPSAEALTALLSARPDLKALDLQSGTEAQSALPLAKLLEASPGLESLKLTNVDLRASSTQGCAQAFQNSKLREFGFVKCTLSDRVSSLELLRASHAELITGLSTAPFLSMLEVNIVESLRELAKLEVPACQLVLEAFGDNPAARIVRKIGFEGGRDKIVVWVEQINKKREENKYVPLEIKYLPVRNTGVDDEDEASSLSFGTVRDVLGGNVNIGDMVSAIQDPEEMAEFMKTLDEGLLGILDELQSESDDDAGDI